MGTQASNGKILNVVDNEDTVLLTPIPVDSSNPNQDTRVNFTEDVSLGSGVTKTFEFDKFQGSGNGNSGVQMKNESVKATFYFSDGSSEGVNIEP